jgi:hypothetical protein
MDSSDSSLSQRTGSFDLNESLFCRGLGPCGLCHKEMTLVDWSHEMGGGGITRTGEASLSFGASVSV